MLSVVWCIAGRCSARKFCEACTLLHHALKKLLFRNCRSVLALMFDGKAKSELLCRPISVSSDVRWQDKVGATLQTNCGFR
jgi:hypothetical protein